MFLRSLFFIAIIIMTLASCQGPRQEVYEVDFINNDSSPSDTISESVLRVAIATVISPRESFVYYQEMFEVLSEHLDMPVEFKQRTTYEEVNQMLARNLVDMAFICSGAYIQGADYMELMFVPIVYGEPYYRGYIISNTDSDIHRFGDFEGRSFTYSDPMCFTGSLFVNKRLKELGTNSGEFFGEMIHSMSHDLSIQMVSRNLIDGAAVNGLIFDYLNHARPGYVENLRIIEKTEPGGIPPVVNSLLMSRELRSQIQEFFTNMHHEEHTRQILDELMIDRFTIVGDTLYDSLRETIEEIRQ